MRVTTIPDDVVWAGAQRVVMNPPDGDLTGSVRAVEAIADVPESIGGVRFTVRCALEDGELETLAAGGHVWVSFYGGMPVFSVDVQP